jgi:hypothetical protein
VLVAPGNQVVRTDATLDIAFGALRIRVLEIAFAAQLTALSSATFANASIDTGLTEYARVVDLALIDDVCLCRRAALGRLDAPYSIVVSLSFEGFLWRVSLTPSATEGPLFAEELAVTLILAELCAATGVDTLQPRSVAVGAAEVGTLSDDRIDLDVGHIRGEFGVSIGVKFASRR